MFPKHGATVNKNNKGSISGLFWMLFGSLLTIVIAVFLYVSPLFEFRPVVDRTPPPSEYQMQTQGMTDNENDEVDDGNEYEFYDVLPRQEMMTIPNTAIVREPEEKPLKKFRADAVVIIEEEKADKNTEDNPPKTIEEIEDALIAEQGPLDELNHDVSAEKKAKLPKKTYVLQINSFSNVDEADRRRAQVMMAGVEAQVIKIVSENDKSIYQVISEPMINQLSVMQAQQLLQNNGIDSLIVEQHRKHKK